MHHIKCPHCNFRDENEFQYGGDASVVRPTTDDEREFFEYVYLRENPKGWHVEWWHHVGGCRQWIKVVRNTATHEIYKTFKAGEKHEVPDEN